MALRTTPRDETGATVNGIPALLPVRPSMVGGAPVRPQAKPSDAIYDLVLAQIEPAMAVRLARPELTGRVERLVAEVANERRLLMNQQEQKAFAAAMVDDMIGLGPLENLLRDETVSDILVNGPNQIYVERRGKLILTDLEFRNDLHVLYVAQRIASSVGRRVDESSPMLDARLADGSRVNVVIPPLSLRGPSISIRKFTRTFLDFTRMIQFKSLSPELARAMEIAAHCRLNILISGGTGSGKTTLLNAMSSPIDPGERVVTIEDTAELQLQQPHVVPLETRPPNVEGRGEITQRDLVRNALRMRPDRIIVGEVRGPEAFDMLQAMNTGHNGSMSTIHANSARDALARVENMVMMANTNLPSRAIRGQIVSALDLIVQIERMRDGTRRVTELCEVVGMEEDLITLATLFTFHYAGESQDGGLTGMFVGTGTEPRFLKRLEYYGLEKEFMQTISGPATEA
ncbi:MAG TPA: CpaF family protein [Stellaceae bacterium]|nr:CpaF family protein [Stellaceae bacterium]